MSESTTFTLTDEQRQLRDTVREFLDRRSPESEVRRLMATEAGYDPAVWQQMGKELGLQGIAIPEQFGGAGYSFVELAVVTEELGRRLACVPFLSTVVLAANALLHSGDQHAQRAYLPGIADGDTIATLALIDDVRLTTAAQSHGEWTIHGRKSYVLDGHTADLILVTALTDVGLSMFSVSADAPGVVRTALPTMDQTRKQAAIDFTGTPATLIGADGQAASIVERVQDLGAVALSCEQVGGAAVALEMATDYAKVRKQFGRPIGSFQAIKHKCATMLVNVETAKSAAYYARWCAAQPGEDLSVSAALAKAYCSRVYFDVASENIQIHGGIGFTWEHPAHLYLKRAKSTELLLGTPTKWRTQLADRIGL